MVDLLGWINYLIDSIFNLVKKFFDGIQDFFQDIFFWIFRLFLDFALFLAGMISTALPVIDTNFMWLAMGSDALSVAGYLGLPEAMAIITAAYTTRFCLNLTPGAK